jgi:molecular chaperone DnaK
MKQILSKAVGIDLGTTNSAVAVMDRTDMDIVLHRDRHTVTTPSCVWKDPRSGELVVGRMAARRVGTAPAPIRSVKRLMGRQETVRVTDEDMAPERVSSLVLAEMKRQIQQDVAAWDSTDTSWEVDRAIVTVPAYFDQPAIEATRHAAELAGLEVLDLLHEPTAAACYHCWSSKTANGTFLVYDLGGGTFDASVVRCTSGAFEVLGISGNNMLGGDNVDVEMARRLQEYLVEDGYALDLDLAGDDEDKIRFAQLKFLAEGVKQGLSTQNLFMFRDSGTMRDKDGTPVIIDRMVERAEFEEVARPVVARTIGYCHEVMALAGKVAGISLSDVDQVILAGGSTHMPLVREMVTRELCGPDGARCEEPVYEKVDTIVALGAAIRASAVGGLRSHNPERTLRVSFRGTGATGATATRVAGRAQALTADTDLDGGHIRLSTGGYDDEVDLGPDGVFSFTRVPIQAGAESLLSFELYNRDGDKVMSTARTVTHGDDLGTDGGETSPPTLSKSFSLQVNRAGRPHVKELVSAMALLPAGARFSFQHPGNTEQVLFPLYQHRRRVQVIEVPVPASTPRGAEITFDVHIDGKNMITVRGTVGSTEFDARVVQAPPRPEPTRAEVDQLASRFANSVLYLKAGDRAVAEAKWDMTMASLETAWRNHDLVQLEHDLEELEFIIDSLAVVEITLVPPKAEFDAIVTECRELNHRVRQAVVGTAITHDEHELAKSIDVQVDQGERAYRNRDQRAYGEAIEQLYGILRWLDGQYQKTPEGKDNRSEEERVADAAASVAHLARGEVMRLAESKGRADFAREVTEIMRDLAECQRDAGRDPSRTQTRIAQHHRRLRQIRDVLLSGAHDVESLPVEATS